MQRESRHLATVLTGGLLLLVGIIGMFAPEIFGSEHNGFREKASALMAGAGGILLAFGDPRAAIDGIRKLLPWGKGNSRESGSIPTVRGPGE